MAAYVVLDSGPLGESSKNGGTPSGARSQARLRALANQGMRIVVPEIADYEVRRELSRLRNLAGIRRLDSLRLSLGFEPITSRVMTLAADLWGQSRRTGRPTSHPHALDGDVILAAQARLLVAPGDTVVVATTNVGHLRMFIATMDWNSIS